MGQSGFWGGARFGGSALFGALVLVAIGFSFPAWAERASIPIQKCNSRNATKICDDLNDPSKCTDADDAISWDCPGTSDYVSGRLASGPAVYAIDVPVDASGSMACRYASNSSSSSAFVPFRSWQEWSAFIGNHPSNIQLSFCGRPTQFVIGPDRAKCDTPNPAGFVTAYLPSGDKNALEFRKQGNSKDYIVAFSCAGNPATKALEIISLNYKVAATAVGGNRASNDVPYTPKTWVTPANIKASGWTQTGSSAIILGGCGGAYDTPVPGNLPAPTGALCGADGVAPGVNVTASNVVVDRTPQWTWTCSQAGTTTNPQNQASVTCSAPITAACGPANGSLSPVEPTGDANLCAWGKPQNMGEAIVGGKHIWTWQCACPGTCTPGHTITNCSASDSVAAQCGTAHNKALSVAPPANPASNLCLSGTASAVTAEGPGGTGPWSWTCTGSTQVSCKAKLKAGCGAADGKPFTEDNPPTMSTPDLCVEGNTASNLTGSGPWSWTCTGSGGQTASCSAPLNADGVCGSDNGKSLATTPTNLCVPESSPPVTKVSGGWTWQCPGQNGGSATNCSATELPSGPACGPGAFQQVTCNDEHYDVPYPDTDEGKCSYGTPSEVSRKSASTTNTDRYYYSGRLYWEWTCSAGGSSVTCQTPICSCAMCGEAFNNTSNGASKSAPSGLTPWQLCMNGVFDESFGFQQNTTTPSTDYYNPNWSKWWVWKCRLVRDNKVETEHGCHVPRN